MKKKFKSISLLIDRLKKSLFDSSVAYLEPFDPEYYLKIYPDVANAGVDAYFHYTHHGKAEGRIGVRSWQFKSGSVPYCKEKKTVLLVSHGASRSGAPIIVFNICQALNQQYNVIVLFLDNGSILPFFDDVCSQILTFNDTNGFNLYVLKDLIDIIKLQYSIHFCIVNSIESHLVLQPLAENFIQTLLLIHEFYSYTWPKSKFVDSFFWAHAIVFPAKIVQKNAENIGFKNSVEATYIAHQGKCEIPQIIQNNERERGKHLSEDDINSFIVLGAGTVEYRKGVDLFIAAAAEITTLYPDATIKMIWIGDGFDPEQKEYASYLAEQVKRSHLHSNRFELIGAVSNLEDLYPIADVFFLSSRLDPFPNVAIDALMLGVPVICFENATGIVEFFERDNDLMSCVASYLSVTSVVSKIMELYKSKEYYALISKKIKHLSSQHFSMQAYVEQLLDIIGNQKNNIAQEALDCTTLENTDDFIVNFCLYPNLTRSEAIRRYVRSWYSQVHLLQEPAPGFNRMLYDLHHNCRARHVEPFADYIRSGKPVGPWSDMT